MNEILVIGGGGHAKSCIDVIESSKKYKIAGLVCESISEKIQYPVLGNDSHLQDLRKKYDYAIIGIGQIQSPEQRISAFNLVNDLEFKLPSIISPYSYLSKYATIGKGTVLFHFAVVNANACVKDNCIINTKSLVEHDSMVSSHCHISTGAILNGGVNIGEGSFIGSGAIVRESVDVGSNCTIGGGVFVKKNVKSNQVVKK
tara:strand:+ start:7773 stop:8375 length:603 start_codon:yes stop_codon:yes gene_type:complete